jgi:uncharacterized protein YndB with AHSA1/START domain
MTARRKLTIERSYRANLDEVWALWTTRAGIESWWGPVGFSVTVRDMDLRPGGALLYVMTATAPEQVAFMKQAGMPLSTEAMVRFTAVEPPRRLAYTTLTDFVPGVAPYDVETVVELEEAGAEVRMVLTFDAMHDDVWTERARAGHEGQLTKLEARLAGR